MKRAFRNIAALTWTALALGFSPLWAQKPKSQKEQQAILAVQVAKTPDERVTAIENVLTNFADTEFKVPLLQMAVQSEQQKNDYAQTVFYADRLLKADPKNAFALVTLASETARHTRENDLDKDEQLAKVDKWAKDAIEAAKVMPKVRADVSGRRLGWVQERHGSPGLRGHGHGRCGAEELRWRRRRTTNSPWQPDPRRIRPRWSAWRRST